MDEVSAEQVSRAELSDLMSVKRKTAGNAVTMPTQVELSSDAEVVMQHGNTPQSQVRDQRPLAKLSGSNSTRQEPRPPESREDTGGEEITKLKEAAARLEERRRRLQELNKIEEEAEKVRRRIAVLEGER